MAQVAGVMKRCAGILAGVVVLAGLVFAIAAVPAFATARPAVDGLSTHHATYWGGMRITVHGRNFSHVKAVKFGAAKGHGVHVLSDVTLTVVTPEHSYGHVHVHVVTSTGASSTSSADEFTFTEPTMHSRIQGGLTALQEQHISARVRAAHHGVHTAAPAARWTAAMGVTAVERANSWLGLPYSWAGGSASGPTYGVCAHNGGDMDCHIIGFDCSGLALYAWAPYRTLVHFAATQHSEAGRFHPTIGQLMPGDLVFFSGYIADGIGHVAVYAGDGMVIQAAESGTQVMRSRLVDVIAANGVYRGATRPMSTGRQGPTPQLSSVTSRVPAKGGYVTVTGTHLGNATSVTVGGHILYSFVRRFTNRLEVKVPSHKAGRVVISVSNSWGTDMRALTYVGAPTTSSLSPSQGPTTGGNTVTIKGANLATVTKVTLGSTSVSFHVVSNRLTLTMPAHAARSVAITLFSPFGRSKPRVYRYQAPSAPTPSPSPTPTTTTTTTTGAPPTAPQTTSSAPSTTPSSSTDSAPSAGPTTATPTPSATTTPP